MMTKCDKTSSIENKSTTTLGKRAAQNVLKFFSNLNLSIQQLDDVLDHCDVVSVEDHFINDDIASLSTASKCLDLQYTNSLTTKNAKLFPNSLPSVRRSRRRLKQSMTTENAFFASYTPYITPYVFPALQQESVPVQASIAQVSQTRQLKTNTTRLTPKKLKANCSKKKILLQVKSDQTTNIAGDNNNDMKQRNCHKSSHHRSSSYIYIPKNAITTLSLALNHSKQQHQHQQQQQQQKASSLPSSSILTFASSSAETSVTPLGQENTLALPPRTSSSSSSSLAQALSHTSLHQSYHSQQSSLISYDRSCSTSRQSLQTHAAATDSAKQNDKHSVQSIILDDTFLSSGISCPSETQSEASTNSPTFHKSILQRLSMAISSKNVHAENTSNAEDNVLISNELTTTTTNKNQQEEQQEQKRQQYDQMQQRQHKQQQQQQQCCNIVYSNEPKLSALREDANVFTTLLPATDLCSLNKCRNRNAVWMHATNSNSYWLADDLQLSDIEEQLHKMQLSQSNCLPQNDNNIQRKTELSDEDLHKSKTL
ncbi:hypothetical protein GQX74_005218 [Glossina fuscipes]|nr:hypothetical protein GQX74_005218 [Glossina fuscipes]